MFLKLGRIIKEEMEMAIDRFLIHKIQTCTYEPMRINLLKLLLIRIEKALDQEEAVRSMVSF